MNCNESRGLFSTWIDRQLEPADRAELEEHLQECAECRIAAENARDLHADLVRAFESPRMAAARAAEQVIAAIPRMATPAQAAVQARSPNWISLGLALALGFLMALLVLPPWKSRHVAPEFREAPRDGLAGMAPTPAATMPAPPVARLVLATGPAGVEYDDRTRGAWQPVAKLSHFQCPSEGSVRTNENVRCELVTSEGCVVRMNSSTEIVFHSAGCVELKRGEIWCRSTPEAPLEVLPSLSATVVEHAAPTGGASSWSCTASDATCLLCVTESGDKVRVTAAAGNISVKARHESLQLEPSETATITRERVDRDRSSDRLLAANWMQPLLIRKGHADRELADRVDDLLARIGESEQSELYEAEIRSLGEYGVLPLLKFVESPPSGSDGERRRVAMRIVSDLAPPWAIGDLVGLLKHPDADVRFLSAAALQRLTTQTQGVAAETWRGDPAEWEPAAAAWQTWWSKNRYRYPLLFDLSPLGKAG
ncbi:MAG: anti-sigma factor family protein [Deltaproteobacteria bacterium]